MCSLGTVKLPDAFGGQPFRFCCVRKVCVACKDGPRGGISGGAGSGGESLPLSENKMTFVSVVSNITPRRYYKNVAFSLKNISVNNLR